MARQLTRWQAAVLGLIVLLGIGLGAWVLLVLDERRGLDGSAITVHAGFADIAGVEVGARVRIQGMDAGEVEAITPPSVPGEPVKLKLRVAGRLRHLVGADARAQIASETLVSGKIVRILPGSAAAAPVEDGALIASLPVTELADGIAQATAKLNVVISKVDATIDGVQRGEGTLGQLVKNDSLYKDLSVTLGELQGTLKDIRSPEGTLGKLAKSNDMYMEAMASLQDVRKMVSSVKQNSDAIKALPVVRNYVVDPHKELIRPDRTRYRKWFPEETLFEPGRAALTESGKKALDDIADWLNQDKDSTHDIVVAAYAAPAHHPDVALTLTQKQAEAVADHLRTTHRVHRTGWWWWATRTVRPLGVGNNPPPVPGNDGLPPARVEVIVFLPSE